MSLRDYDVLTFDCYGTLIDWETGLFTAMAPLLARIDAPPFRDEALAIFARHEVAQQAETPDMLYADVLAAVHRRLEKEWGVEEDAGAARAFGGSIGEWPAFSDTVEALRYLKQHYKLVILSNVDRNSFSASNARLGVEFDAIYTAQDIGSYKPDPRNFTYLLERLGEQGIARERVLHVAQSLFHDHVPANGIGLASAWIDRRHDTPGWGATAPVHDVRYDYRFPSLGALAEAHREGG
jgi:2-haloalkanoic acid dehalogenase type II